MGTVAGSVMLGVLAAGSSDCSGLVGTDLVDLDEFFPGKARYICRKINILYDICPSAGISEYIGDIRRMPLPVVTTGCADKAGASS